MTLYLLLLLLLLWRKAVFWCLAMPECYENVCSQECKGHKIAGIFQNSWLHVRIFTEFHIPGWKYCLWWIISMLLGGAVQEISPWLKSMHNNYIHIVQFGVEIRDKCTSMMRPHAFPCYQSHILVQKPSVLNKKILQLVFSYWLQLYID